MENVGFFSSKFTKIKQRNGEINYVDPVGGPIFVLNYFFIKRKNFNIFFWTTGPPLRAEL